MDRKKDKEEGPMNEKEMIQRRKLIKEGERKEAVKERETRVL